MQPISLAEKRKIQLRLLHEVHTACQKYNLTYYLAFGTLLGAVRHHGFIPWDDDLDVMMPLEDIIKLSECYTSDNYRFLTCYNNKEMGYPFARIYANETYEKRGSRKGLGVNIDIYPIVGASAKKEEQNDLSAKYERWRTIRILLRKFQGGLNRLHLWPEHHLDNTLLTWACKRTIAIFKKYSSYKEADSVYIIGTYYNRYLPPEWFKESVLLTFENNKYHVPKAYDSILREYYNDYMKLPPEEQRVPYHGGRFYMYNTNNEER